jgi:cobalt-zinc-cadmium efflux system outer membrane protein
MLMLLLALAVQQPGDSLSLRAALTRARGQRPLSSATAASVAEARGALRSAGAIPNPTVAYSHSEAFPLNHLTVEQPLDWLLRRGADRDAGRAGVARAGADSMQAMAQLDRDVRSAYWSARASREASALAAAEAVEADSLAAIAGARFRAGEISLLEQEQAEQEAALTRQAESRAREVARVSAFDLARALGQSDGTIIPTDPLDSELDRPPPGDLLPAATPAVRSAVADSVSAAAQLRATARARVPIPSLQAGAEWGDPSQPGSLSTIGFAIPLPLWNQGGGGMTGARARATRASALAAETRLEVDRLIRGAKVHLEETALRARVARDSLVPSAARIRGRAMRGYAAGETGILPALDALRNERLILLQALQDQLAFQLALADWHALTGSDE